jgi:hypothetical protein
MAAPGIASETARPAKPGLLQFALLALPLLLLLAVFRIFRIEQPEFFRLSCVVFGGFAVSYWLPRRFRRLFLTLLSVGGAYVVLSPLAATALIGSGALIFAVVRSPFSFWPKVLILAGLFGAAAWFRAGDNVPVLHDFWPVLGALFMFRLIVYLYDLRHQPRPVTPEDFFSYFFLLPNYYFLLFPVVDFQTFRQCYLKRDIHVVAREGVWWIVRGTTHLLLYRIIFQSQANFSPPHVSVALAVAAKMLISYVLYLRISGQFHIAVGMLHLFGYDLPETNRRYLLASGVNDLWRRINIYWKDFMVKIVYFPAYFKLRRKGDLRAQLLSTMLVILVTWVLHAYQFFWLQNSFRMNWNDTIFWTVLGLFMMMGVWRQSKRRGLRRDGWSARLGTVATIAGTLALMSVLWSLWSANSLGEWLTFLRTGNV